MWSRYVKFWAFRSTSENQHRLLLTQEHVWLSNQSHLWTAHPIFIALVSRWCPGCFNRCGAVTLKSSQGHVRIKFPHMTMAHRGKLMTNIQSRTFTDIVSCLVLTAIAHVEWSPLFVEKGWVKVSPLRAPFRSEKPEKACFSKCSQQQISRIKRSTLPHMLLLEIHFVSKFEVMKYFLCWEPFIDYFEGPPL
jgi:hypothetical protein